MTALVLRCRVPAPPVSGRWRGPDGSLAALAQAERLGDIVAVIGPTGPPGAAASHFSHTQASPSETWTVNHNLGFKPNVSIFSVGGVEVEATVIHTSINQTVIEFSIPYSGTAEFS